MKVSLIKVAVLLLAIFAAGCSPGRHTGHIYIHDEGHIEAVFDRPMSISYERDGVKVEANSLKPGFFEDVLKFMLIKPR